MEGSRGYRRLPRGSDHFSWQTDTQTLHHNIYIIIITWIGGGSQRIAAQASPDHRTLEEGQLWSEPPWFDRSDDKTWQWQPGFVSFSLSCPWTLWLRPLSPLGGQPKTDRDEVYKSFVPSKISTMVKGAGYFHSAGQSRALLRRGNLVLALPSIQFSWNFYQIIIWVENSFLTHNLPFMAR